MFRDILLSFLYVFVTQGKIRGGANRNILGMTFRDTVLRRLLF